MELLEAAKKLYNWMVSMEAVKAGIDVPDDVWEPFEKALKQHQPLSTFAEDVEVLRKYTVCDCSKCPMFEGCESKVCPFRAIAENKDELKELILKLKEGKCSTDANTVEKP